MRADEKHIRTQSAILYKSKPKPLLRLSMNNRVFGTDVPLIRTKDTVGARSAQLETPCTNNFQQ